MGDRRHPSPRRQFLRTSALAGAAVSLGGPAWPRSAAGNAVAEGEPLAPSWIDKPMRWAQLTLVEDDPVQLDVPFWLDSFKRTHSDAACLSAGGCVAYYPTEIPFHHRSAWLGGRDVFGELVTGCRELGMVVVARTDPHATYDDVQAAHPDWIAVGEDGRAPPPLGLAGDVGHLRPGPLQLRVHDRGAAGDHGPLPGGRHLRQPLGRVRHVLLRALPGRLPRRHRSRPPAGRRPAGCRAARVSAVAGGAAPRPVAPLGLGSAPGQPRLLSHSQHRRRRHQPPGHGEDRRAGADAGGRSSGAPRAHGALGHRHEREGVPGRDGRQARGRPLQRRGRGGLPVEGLRAECGRDPPLDRGPRRQRHAALVHEVLGHPARPALAPSRRGDLHLVPRSRAVPAQRAPAGPGGARVLAADRVVLRRRPRPRAGRGPGARLVPGARRGPHPLRDGPRPACSTPIVSRRSRP